MSERLTNHFDYCDFTECMHYDKELANSDSCNFIHSSRECCLEYAVYNKLREYEDLEEQGLLLKLPFTMGKNLYDIFEFVEGYDSPDIYTIDTSRVEISRDKEGLIYTIDCNDYREKDFGTVLFKSTEEAIKAITESGWIV